jgi:AraC-like DNA-binding protein
MLENPDCLRDHSGMANDPLGDIVTMAGARCDISTRLIAGKPWALSYPPPRQIKFMAVVKGSCWLDFDRIGPRPIGTGDILMMTEASSYTLASEPGVPPVDAVDVFADLAAKEVKIGGADDFIAIGGHVSLDSERGWMLADALPPMLHIDSNAPEASTLRHLLDQLVSEVGSNLPGAGLMAEQLAQMLFVHAMRCHLSQFTLSAPGWSQALMDNRLAPVLRQMHRNPGRQWRLDELAKIVAMSRTAFAVRFKEASGVAPLVYLANWRMLLAQQRLRQTLMPISVIAAALGYASESAFSNAFKRTTGTPPSQYRTMAERTSNDAGANLAN